MLGLRSQLCDPEMLGQSVLSHRAVIRVTGPNLHILSQHCLGRLFGSLAAKTGQCFIASVSSLRLVLQEEGIRVRKRQHRSGKNINLLNKRTKCFKEIDPKGMETGPGPWHPGGVAEYPVPSLLDL